MDTKVIVSDYNPQWVEDFCTLKKIFTGVLKGLETDIQHVGSTSVPGLAAKPVIDIDIIIKNEYSLPSVARRLESIGYIHRGNLGIPQRESFKHLTDIVDGAMLPIHNLYVCIEGSDSLKNHLALRDYLLAHPEKAAEYSNLKKQLMAEFPENIDKYVEGKTPFIVAALKECGFSPEALEAIADVNKAK